MSWAPEAGEVQPHYLVDNPVGTCGRQALLGLSDQPELSQVPGREEGSRGRAGDGGRRGKRKDTVKDPPLAFPKTFSRHLNKPNAKTFQKTA